MPSSRPGRVVIVGAGAQSRYVINTLRLGQSYEVAALLDTFGNPAMWGKRIGGVSVAGPVEEIARNFPAAEVKLVLAVADRERKRALARELAEQGYRFLSIVHPSVQLAYGVEIGEGSIVNAGVVIESDSRIGRHVIVHAGCILEHDNVVADFANLGPGVKTAGRVKIGEGAIVYTGAALIPDVEIGENAIVGAGAVVIESVPADATVVGIPARALARKA